MSPASLFSLSEQSLSRSKSRPAMPTHSEVAAIILAEENTYRFTSFTANDAVTLGLSLRKRFRGSSRHVKHGHGLIISIQTIAGHPLFSCTVGDMATGDVGLDHWDCIEAMVKVVRRTGHSSFYAEKAENGTISNGKKLDHIPENQVKGGAFPIWLHNATCCPIAVAAVYGGSSHEDHHLVANTIRDYVAKMQRNSDPLSMEQTI